MNTNTTDERGIIFGHLTAGEPDPSHSVAYSRYQKTAQTLAMCTTAIVVAVLGSIVAIVAMTVV